LYFNYTGGLNVSASSYGYYIANAYGIGIYYPFHWLGTNFTTYIVYQYTANAKSSYDPELSLYFWKGTFHYRLIVTGSFTIWTVNKNQDNNFMENLQGKKFEIIGDPQIWLKIIKRFYIGSRINVYFNLIDNLNQLEFYPTMGVKYAF
jgi:hypothetical protein